MATSSATRRETDSFGAIDVPAERLWGAQTQRSLRRHVLEEAYEVAAAIDELPVDAPGGQIPAGAYDALEDELGDLLFQVMIHSVLASEAGAFTIADVAREMATAVRDFGSRRHDDVSRIATWLLETGDDTNPQLFVDAATH